MDERYRCLVRHLKGYFLFHWVRARLGGTRGKMLPFILLCPAAEQFKGWRATAPSSGHLQIGSCLYHQSRPYAIGAWACIYTAWALQVSGGY